TDPNNARYAVATKAQTIRKEQEKQQEKRRRQFIDVRTRWGQPSQWAAPLTLALIAISIVVSVGTGSIHVGPMRGAVPDKLKFASTNDRTIAQFEIKHRDDPQESRQVTRTH